MPLNADFHIRILLHYLDIPSQYCLCFRSKCVAVVCEMDVLKENHPLNNLGAGAASALGDPGHKALILPIASFAMAMASFVRQE